MHPKSEPEDGASRRLESWKEIAAYLDRSVRTVRRWESGEKLPVHRHKHAKGATVFAYVEELDRWRNSRVSANKPQPEAPPEEQAPASEPQPRPRERIMFRLVAATAGIALVLALVALSVSLSASDPSESLDLWIRTIPVEERLLLEAGYHRSRGAHEAAVRAFEAVLGTGSLGREAVEAALASCGTLDAPARCTALVRRASDRSPEDATLAALAARALTRSVEALDDALVYAERASSRQRLDPSPLEPELASFVELLPARKAWLDGDIARSARELDRIAQNVSGLSGESRDAVASAAGLHCLALGRIGCAKSWFSRIGDERVRHEMEGYRLFAAGKMEALRAHLTTGVTANGPTDGAYDQIETSILLAMAGQPTAAEAVIDSFAGRSEDGAREVARGGLELLAGRPMEAMPRLSSGLAALAERGSGIRFIGLDMLSRIAEKRGEMDQAVELLEMTSQERDSAILRGSGLFWIKCQTRLADVYRNLERTDEALRVERELLTALALADADHPTTAAIRQRSA